MSICYFQVSKADVRLNKGDCDQFMINKSARAMWNPPDSLIITFWNSQHNVSKHVNTFKTEPNPIHKFTVGALCKRTQHEPKPRSTNLHLKPIYDQQIASCHGKESYCQQSQVDALITTHWNSRHKDSKHANTLKTEPKPNQNRCKNSQVVRCANGRNISQNRTCQTKNKQRERTKPQQAHWQNIWNQPKNNMQNTRKLNENLYPNSQKMRFTHERNTNGNRNSKEKQHKEQHKAMGSSTRNRLKTDAKRKPFC